MTCSTLSKHATVDAGDSPKWEAGGHCTAWDRRTGDVREVPCTSTIALLAEATEGAGLLSRPTITAVSTVSPVESVPIPVTNVIIGGLYAAAFSRVPSASARDAEVAASWNAVKRDDDGTVSPGAARELLAICAGAPPAEKEYRSIALLIVPRDDRAAAGVLLLGLALTLWLLLRSSAVVTVDPVAAELVITERRGPFASPPVRVGVGDVADVVVTHGALGPFAGRRVEVLLRNGDRVPLVSTFGPIASGPHERTLTTLRRALGLRYR